MECLQDWASFLRLAIPSMLMLCIEWWAYEVGSFLSGAYADGMPDGNRLAGARHQLSVFTGILGMVELGAQSIAYELAIIVYMVSAQDPVVVVKVFSFLS